MLNVYIATCIVAWHVCTDGDVLSSLLMDVLWNTCMLHTCSYVAVIATVHTVTHTCTYTCIPTHTGDGKYTDYYNIVLWGQTFLFWIKK